MENEYLRTKKILIVEDDVSSRLYLNKILEKTGAALISACDGREAIEIAKSDPGIDIILMDIQLPFVDGYGAAAKIREFRNDVLIMAQTAYSLLGDRERIISSGFDDYIVKPIFPRQLIEKLITLIQRKA